MTPQRKTKNRMNKELPKHTAGSWTVTGIAGDNNIMARTRRGGHEVLCNVCIVTGWPGIDPEEFEANKALISAAPDLFEACEALVDCISVDGVGVNPIIPTDTRNNRALALAMATLKKARGQ